MQRRYYTLAGDRFDLDTLTTDEVVTIEEIRKIAPDLSDEEYLNRARRLIRQIFPTYAASNRVLSGAVGSVYRDLWYRRQRSRTIDPQEIKRLLANIRVHPARPICDAFLDSGISQADFARQIGVSRSVMSRLVSLFSARSASKEDRKSEEPLSTTTLVAVLSRLGVSFRSLYVDEVKTRFGVSSEHLAAPLTIRESLLLQAIIEGVCQVNAGNAKPLAQRLARLFNTVDIQFIDSIVKSVLRVLGFGVWSQNKHFEISEILWRNRTTVPSTSGESIRGLSASLERLLDLTRNDTVSDRRLQHWETAEWGGAAVQAALADSDRPKLFGFWEGEVQQLA